LLDADVPAESATAVQATLVDRKTDHSVGSLGVLVSPPEKA
jgi:hypothetical protein